MLLLGQWGADRERVVIKVERDSAVGRDFAPFGGSIVVREGGKGTIFVLIVVGEQLANECSLKYGLQIACVRGYCTQSILWVMRSEISLNTTGLEEKTPTRLC